MIDIYCRDSKCPICDSTMKISSLKTSLDIQYIKICHNECYRIEMIENKNVGNYITSCKIFDKKINQMLVSYITNKVEYWKTNERYLTKILED